MGRIDEQAASIADLRSDRRQAADGLAGLDARIDGVNARIDRLFLALLGIGAAQIALLVTLIIRQG
jgi:hypothetical protein